MNRTEALASGQPYYTSEKPCPQGEIAPRRTSNGQCTCEKCLEQRAEKTAQRFKRYTTDEEFRRNHNTLIRQSRIRTKERRKELARTVTFDQQVVVNARNRKWYNNMPEAERAAYSKAKYYKDAVRTMYSNAKARAKRNGTLFTLAHEDIIIPPLCPVFNQPFVWGDGRDDFSPSLDRIDSSKGYEPGNVCVVSWLANRLKNNATLTQLEQVCDYIRQKLCPRTPFQGH